MEGEGEDIPVVMWDIPEVDGSPQASETYSDDIVIKREPGIPEIPELPAISVIPKEPWSPPPPPDITLSPEQDSIVRHILSGNNTFFTGPAGCGKSLIIKHLNHALHYPPIPAHYAREQWEEYYKGFENHCAVTAPTGVAALLIKGRTVHSWAGIGVCDKGIGAYKRIFWPGPLYSHKRDKMRERRLKPWKETKVLVLDEVSMVQPDLFETLNEIGKVVRRDRERAFGGLKVVLSGDFFQLPPVEIDQSRRCYRCGESPVEG